MSEELKNEVSVDQTSTPQSTSTETEPNSVSSTNDNYTPKTDKSQTTKDINIENLSFPLENTEITIQFENAYPSKDELREVIGKCKIIRLNQKLHIHKDGIYTLDIRSIRSKLYRTCDKADHLMVNRLINDIELEIDSNSKECSATLVGFNDCILDTEDFKAKEFNSADFVLTSKLAINYVEQNAISNIDKRLQVIKIFFTKITCGNKQLELLLYIIIGMCCCRSNNSKVAFVLAGNTCNSEDGRSVFIELLDRILGNSVSHKNLRKLADVKSSLELYGKTCNISEEVEHPNISYMDNIRNLITGKEQNVCNAHSNLVFTPYTTFLINVKEILDFGTALFGMKDYFKIIPFNAKRPIKQKILDVLFEAETLQYIALQGIKAYCQAIRIGKLPVVDVVESATANYFRDNNSVKAYFTEYPINKIALASKCYSDYCMYCIDTNSKRISRANFGTKSQICGYKHIRPSFKNIRINQSSKENRIHCYVSEDFDIEDFRQKFYQMTERLGYDNSKQEVSISILAEFIDTYERGEFSNAENQISRTGDNQEFYIDISSEELDI